MFQTDRQGSDSSVEVEATTRPRSDSGGDPSL